MPVPVRVLDNPAVRVAALASMLLMSACAKDAAPVAAVADDESAADRQDVAQPPPPAGTHANATPGTGATIGGDGSEIQLGVLDAQDVAQAQLAGELSCAFVHDDGALLHAAGNVASVDPALGVVKVSGVVERVRAPGGFDGILEDPVFTGRGLTLRIRSTGPAIGGGESPPRPATLTYLRADGASRSFGGRWQCGP